METSTFQNTVNTIFFSMNWSCGEKRLKLSETKHRRRNCIFNWSWKMRISLWKSFYENGSQYQAKTNIILDITSNIHLFSLFFTACSKSHFEALSLLLFYLTQKDALWPQLSTIETLYRCFHHLLHLSIHSPPHTELLNFILASYLLFSLLINQT